MFNVRQRPRVKIEATATKLTLVIDLDPESYRPSVDTTGETISHAETELASGPGLRSTRAKVIPFAARRVG